MLAMAVCFLNLGPLTVLLRFSVRRMQNVRFGTDDWLIVTSLGLMIVLCINIIVGAAFGVLGRSLSPRTTPDGTVNEATGFSFELAEASKVRRPVQLRERTQLK